MKSALTLWRIIFMAFFMLFAHTIFAQTVQVKMRDSGYTMGDFIYMHVEIALPDNQQLDPESLPLTGRVKPWLDLHALNMRTQNGKIQLDLTWQIFATVEIAQPLKTPEIILKTIAKKPQNIHIAAQTFYYSPVLVYPLGDVQRRADLPPLKFDERTPRFWTMLLASLALVGGAAWLWLKDLLPWWPHRPGPMTQLARNLRRNHWGNVFKNRPAGQYPYGLQRDDLESDVLNIDSLRSIHQALNTSAGESLYPHTLHQLFMQAPYMESEKAAISQFFHASWQQFYAPQSFKNEAERIANIDPQATLAWIQSAALAERLFRRQAARNGHV